MRSVMASTAAVFQSSPTREGGRDASYAPPRLLAESLFQSSPTREGGRDLTGAVDVLTSSLFQSSPTREGGRDCGGPRCEARRPHVSILAHP